MRRHEIRRGVAHGSWVALNLGTPAPVVRTTDGLSGNSGGATKIFVDGSLSWSKTDQTGAPLAGATFKVCRTHGFDSSGPAFAYPALDPEQCVTLLDNSGQ